MTGNRPAIPAEIKRAVLLEAGHRCAIPTCRFPTAEIAHIVPFKEAQDNRFENLIALCPNCHTRYDGDEIDRKSMQAYKRNLPVVAGRYTDLESRMLAELGAAVRRGVADAVIIVPGGSAFLFGMAIKDGLLEYLLVGSGQTGTSLTGPDGTQIMVETSGACKLTPMGKEFADRWLSGQALT